MLIFVISKRQASHTVAASLCEAREELVEFRARRPHGGGYSYGRLSFRAKSRDLAELPQGPAAGFLDSATLRSE